MQETNGDGRPVNKPGLYRQKETGQEMVLSDTPPYGTPIIDAFIQAGFVYVGEPKVDAQPEVKDGKSKLTKKEE